MVRWREEETQIFFIPATFSFTGNSSHLPRSRASSPSPSATATSSAPSSSMSCEFIHPASFFLSFFLFYS
ncbi:hypothetical protein DTO282F9_3206 [Paecilomyces variotii]|nr:hypothetical protein DTO282E5_3450 [Paecilomyces variotii]KAJ9399858.1 hypothetical protein DTO282F9_3206 [Paecilomyces variotii]